MAIPSQCRKLTQHEIRFYQKSIKTETAYAKRWSRIAKRWHKCCCWKTVVTAIVAYLLLVIIINGLVAAFFAYGCTAFILCTLGIYKHYLRKSEDAYGWVAMCEERLRTGYIPIDNTLHAKISPCGDGNFRIDEY